MARIRQVGSRMLRLTATVLPEEHPVVTRTGPALARSFAAIGFAIAVASLSLSATDPAAAAPSTPAHH